MLLQYTKEKKKAEVSVMSDGWRVVLSGRTYSWNHHDVDMGTDGISTLLADLGFDVEMIEEY